MFSDYLASKSFFVTTTLGEFCLFRTLGLESQLQHSLAEGPRRAMRDTPKPPDPLLEIRAVVPRGLWAGRKEPVQILA